MSLTSVDHILKCEAVNLILSKGSALVTFLVQEALPSVQVVTSLSFSTLQFLLVSIFVCALCDAGVVFLQVYP